MLTVYVRAQTARKTKPSHGVSSSRNCQQTKKIQLNFTYQQSRLRSHYYRRRNLRWISDTKLTRSGCFVLPTVLTTLLTGSDAINSLNMNQCDLCIVLKHILPKVAKSQPKWKKNCSNFNAGVQWLLKPLISRQFLSTFNILINMWVIKSLIGHLICGSLSH